MPFEEGEEAEDIGKLINCLDSAGIRAVNGGAEVSSLKKNIELGWKIIHIIYKEKLERPYKGQPGFVFSLENSNKPGTFWDFEVPYGSKINQFILEEKEAGRAHGVYYLEKKD